MCKKPTIKFPLALKKYKRNYMHLSEKVNKDLLKNFRNPIFDLLKEINK